MSQVKVVKVLRESKNHRTTIFSKIIKLYVLLASSNSLGSSQHNIKTKCVSFVDCVNLYDVVAEFMIICRLLSEHILHPDIESL